MTSAALWPPAEPTARAETPSTIDWRDVAPDEWFYVVDLVTLPPERPSGIFAIASPSPRAGALAPAARPPFPARIMALAPDPDPLRRLSRSAAPHPRPVPTAPANAWLEAFRPPAPTSRGSAPPWDDCGDPTCLQCGPIIEQRERSFVRTKEGRWHRVRTEKGDWTRAVLESSTVLALRAARDSAWLADLYGTGAERAEPEERYERPSRAKVKTETPRQRCPLDDADAETALLLLKERTRIVRRGVDRRELRAEAWFELVNPSEDCEPVDHRDLATRVDRAAGRAEKSLAKKNRPAWSIPDDPACPNPSLRTEG